jgi:hypothetical protein
MGDPKFATGGTPVQHGAADVVHFLAHDIHEIRKVPRA